MVVALSTLQAEPHPDHRGRLHAVDGVLDTVLFGDGSPFIRRRVVPIETGRDFLIVRRVRDEVSGKLLNRKLVERLVRVVSRDDPVAPRPHVAWPVRVKDAGITVPGRVHPHKRHPLAEWLRGQQLVDDFFISVFAGVCQKHVDLFDGWRQAGQVEGHASQQPFFVGLIVRVETLQFEAFQNESVDGVFRTRFLFDIRYDRLHGRQE